MSADPTIDPSNSPLANEGLAIIPTILKSTFTQLITGAITLLLGIIKGLIVFIIGYIIIKIILFFVRKALNAKDMEAPVRDFIFNVISFILKFLLFTAVLDAAQIEILSIGVLIGALGVAVGFALSGLIGNFVAGMVLLIKKPFKIGDLIEAQGQLGSVHEIGMFMTTLLTLDNRTTTIPNSPLASDILINYTGEDLRRVDMMCGVAYDADLDQARKVITNVLKKSPYVLDEPAYTVAVHELADSSVNFVVRPWCKTPEYWDCHWDVTENLKKQLDKANIGIPFPQRDCHLFDGVTSEPSPSSDSKSSKKSKDVSNKKDKKKDKKKSKK